MNKIQGRAKKKDLVRVFCFNCNKVEMLVDENEQNPICVECCFRKAMEGDTEQLLKKAQKLYDEYKEVFKRLGKEGGD